VYVLPDNDEPGSKFSGKVAKSISLYARGLKIVPLPDLPEKGDASDFLDVNTPRTYRKNSAGHRSSSQQ
jgi:hypothetical protein